MAAPRTQATALRARQVRAVGAGFLRTRPLVVAPVALANVVLLARAGTPVAQRAALGGAIGLALLLFTIEAWVFRRREVPERWLSASLGVTASAIALGAWLSGGLASPLVPLLLAPVVVGIAAFGRGGRTAPLLGLGGALLVALALVPSPFPAVPAPETRWMVGVALAGSAALSLVGVGGLVDAHGRAAEQLWRLRAAALEEADARVREKQQIAAKVAHELKNPLAAVRALTQLFAARAEAERDKKRLAVALAEIDRMDVLVREYLAFARPLADLEPAPLDLADLARDVAAVLEARAEDAGVRVAAEGAPSPAVGDARRLREALLNLASNAVTVTPRGGTVRIAARADVDGAVVTIEDEGPGPPREADAPFVTTTPGGTGLGLVIARATVRQHGGELRFAQRLPRGTVVTLRLPSGPRGEDAT